MHLYNEPQSNRQTGVDTEILIPEIPQRILRGYITLLHLSRNSSQGESSLRGAVLENVSNHLPRMPSWPDPESSNPNGTTVATASTNPDKLFRVIKKHGTVGKLEISYGSVKFFQPMRLCPLQGFGIRCGYSPPTWLARMMISISLTVFLFPRPSCRFGIDYVCEVPWESEILTLAQTGNLEGLTELLRSERASATDRDARGNTALHVCTTKFPP